VIQGAEPPPPSMAGMSFSFSAGGTKKQTLGVLAKAPVSHDLAAATIVDLLAQMVAGGPEESSDGKPILYEATAYGHTAKGASRDDWPSLGVTLSCTTPWPSPRTADPGKPAGS
jgi:hypothetical protein